MTNGKQGEEISSERTLINYNARRETLEDGEVRGCLALRNENFLSSYSWFRCEISLTKRSPWIGLYIQIWNTKTHRPGLHTVLKMNTYTEWQLRTASGGDWGMTGASHCRLLVPRQYLTSSVKRLLNPSLFHFIKECLEPQLCRLCARLPRKPRVET